MNVNNSTKLLGVAVGFNSTLGGGSRSASSSARMLCESARHAEQRAIEGNAPAIGASRRPQNEHRWAVTAADSGVVSSAIHDSQM